MKSTIACQLSSNVSWYYSSRYCACYRPIRVCENTSCLSVCLAVCLSVRLSVCLPVLLYLAVSICVLSAQRHLVFAQFCAISSYSTVVLLGLFLPSCTASSFPFRCLLLNIFFLIFFDTFVYCAHLPHVESAISLVCIGLPFLSQFLTI